MGGRGEEVRGRVIELVLGGVENKRVGVEGGGRTGMGREEGQRARGDRRMGIWWFQTAQSFIHPF